MIKVANYRVLPIPLDVPNGHHDDNNNGSNCHNKSRDDHEGDGDVTVCSSITRVTRSTSTSSSLS